MKTIFYVVKNKKDGLLLSGHYEQSREKTLMSSSYDYDTPYLFCTREQAESAIKDDFYYSWPFKNVDLEVIPVMLLLDKVIK